MKNKKEAYGAVAEILNNANAVIRRLADLLETKELDKMGQGEREDLVKHLRTMVDHLSSTKNALIMLSEAQEKSHPGDSGHSPWQSGNN